MNVVRAVIGVGLVVLLSLSSVSAGADSSAEAIPTREQVHETIGRSLPYLETGAFRGSRTRSV